MPIQFYDLDLDSTGFKGFDGELDSPSFIEDLEFYAPATSAEIVIETSSADTSTAETPVMGSTSAALVTGNDFTWIKEESMDDESLLPMSPPNPFIFSDRLDFDSGGVELESSTISEGNSDVELILIHDCMIAGGCTKCDHVVSRTLTKQSSTNCTNSSNNVSCNSANGNSNNNSHNCGSITNVNSNLRTEQPLLSIPQSRNHNSSCSNINNSSSSNNNNNNNSSFSLSIVNSSSSSLSNTNNSSSSSVIKTIEVPSECGPTRRTGVIVQKTVERSLLIKSRTKSENSCTGSNAIKFSNCSSNSSSPSNNSSSALKSNSSSNNVMLNGIPTPPASCSRPETPQSLSESEEDSCQFDLSSVFFDNPKLPQGMGIWDEIWAAVEQEHASGMIETCNGGNSELNSSSENDPNNNKVCSTPSDSENELSSLDLDEDFVTSTPNVVKSPNNAPKQIVGGMPLNEAILRDNFLSAATTVVSDHSYDKRAWMRLEDLGVQTPSDSEEEIDVVSLSLIERSRASSRSSSISSSSDSSVLPTYPSAQDQEKIQVLTTSKLLNAASKAVSRRLKSKSGGKGKVLDFSNKRRPSSDIEDYQITTRLPKKPRLHYKPKSRFATDSESDSKEKRDLHNNMERMRRIDLRNSFEELKVLVPTLLSKERAPKVQILQEAASYCSELKFESRKLTTQVAALRKEQERLRSTVSGLRRSLAAHR